MKIFIMLLLTAGFINTSIADSRLESAPYEWLITTSLEKKFFENHSHSEKKTEDKLVTKILKSIRYDSVNDEMVLTSNKKLNSLRGELINFLKEDSQKVKKRDPKFEEWSREGSPLNKIRLFKTTRKIEGHYYFNHIHTDISQDNKRLKKLKMTPKETFHTLEKFLLRRKAKGVAALTDHGTDEAFSKTEPLHSETLSILRSVEWGGGTHMGLVDIKKEWNLLGRGREFKQEESIKQSRSSGGFRIMNHPNRNTPYPHTRWGDVNGVEVWNTIVESSPFNWLNLKIMNNRGALKEWQSALEADGKYAAVAGSDFHFGIPCLKERGLVYPVNFVPESETTNIRENLFQGRSSIITRPTAPKLTLKARMKGAKTWSHMGERISNVKSLEVNLFADFSDVNKKIGGRCYNTIRKFHKLLTFWKKRIWEVRFYNKKGDVIAKRQINPKSFGSNKHFQATLEFNISGSDLVRAELWSINKRMKSIDLLGMTNPVYLN